MAVTTNQLVNEVKKMARKPLSVGAGAVLTAALAVSLVFHESSMRAASVNATPIDDNSVAALTALDRAMEAVAAHVGPAVVNVQVTSKGSEEETSQEGGQQQLPPGFRILWAERAVWRVWPAGTGTALPAAAATAGAWHRQRRDHLAGRLHRDQRPRGRWRGAGESDATGPAHHECKGDRRGQARRFGRDQDRWSNLPYLQWGDSSTLKPGETVLAFGSPFGSFQDSVTRGIVSAVNRENPYRDDLRKPGGYIQTDAAINPGNSGGALVNAHGELIGIPTFIISDSGSFAGAGFAIPSQIAEKTAQELIAHGKVEHGYLGISIESVTPENSQFFNLKEATGALVSQVTPDSPAAQAGVKSGDVIDQLDGHKVLDSSSLQIAVSQDNPGQKIQLGILRNGQPMTLSATVANTTNRPRRWRRTAPARAEATPASLACRSTT